MRLTLKLTLALMLVILAVLTINSVVRVRREAALFEQDIRGDSSVLGRALSGAVFRIWTRVGEAEALDLVEDANERESHIGVRWVWLDGRTAGAHIPDVPLSTIQSISALDDVVLRWPSEDSHAAYTYIPLTVPDGRRGAIELKESLNTERDYVKKTIIQAVLTTAVLVALTTAITLGLGALLVGRPVRRLVAQARRIGAGELSQESELNQSDEIGDLAHEMNRMSQQLLLARHRTEEETEGKLAAVEQLRHADRLATVGQLAAGVAHEVGTPLNVITGHAQLIVDEYPRGSSAHGHASTIAEQGRRVAQIIRQLLDFARPRSVNLTSQEIATIAEQVIGFLNSLASKRNVQLELQPGSQGIRAWVDASQFHQVLTNLVVNAIHASPPNALVTLGVERVQAVLPDDLERRQGSFVRVFVRDVGAGIAPQALSRIFEPYFTTKDIGEGTGLGLSIVYGIVKEHQGWLDVDSEVSKGTCFSVYLPDTGNS